MHPSGKGNTHLDSATVAVAESGQTLAAWLRGRLPDLPSWNQVRKLVASRYVALNGELCLDPARRLKEGDRVTVTAHPARAPRAQEAVSIRYADQHLVVVEKPAGLCTVRHPAERVWPVRRKALSPTLEDLVPGVLARREASERKGPPPRLRVVQRLDKETSGLLVFARTVPAERGLGKQFAAHTVLRRYVAVVCGAIEPQTITTRLVRDRGDGRRGSTTVPTSGKEAVTHVEVLERLPGYTVVACRLETGRTHQIRIHLAELGHPLCGEPVYARRRDGSPLPDPSGSPRLALHAADLGFTHPISGQWLQWSMPWPDDLEALVTRLRQGGQRP